MALPSKRMLLRLCTDEDIEHVRQWMSPAERAVLFALHLGIQMSERQVAKTFQINRYQAGRLIERMRALLKDS